MSRTGYTLACLLMLSTVSFGQTVETGELQGTVTDQTGGVLVEVSVSLVSDSGQMWAVETDSEGRYSFETIPPGRYVVIAEAEGFVTFTDSVDLGPGPATLFDFSLNVSIIVSVEVSEPQGLSTNPRRSLSSMILTRRDIDALPDDPALFMQRLIEMAGGAGRPGEVAVFVDGFREYQRLPPKDVIEMIRINSNPFSAEFAGASSERIEITTSPGSDGFHGDLNLQVRDSALEARHPLADTKPPIRYRNYNGYLQGPIREGEVGFMVWAGLARQDENAIIHATVLDPVTLVAQPFGTTVRTPMRSTSALVKSDFKVFGQLVNASYSGSRDSSSSQGLGGGLDLPERAYDESSSDDEIRLWWTWVGQSSINDVRIEFNRNESTTTPRVSAPTFDVLDAFTGGGSQNAGSQTSKGMQIGESVTVQDGNHTWKVGVQMETTWQDSTDRSEFGGTFTFGSGIERDRFGAPVLDASGQPVSIAPIENYRRTLLGRPGYGPSQFSIVSGDPKLDITQWNLGWFLMDDWSVSDRLAVSYGLRQELQNNLGKRLVNVNFAPRGYVSWLLDENGENEINVGGGIFYTPVGAGITLATRRRDGIRQRQLVVQGPGVFPAIPPTGDSAVAVQSSIFTKSDALRMPYSVSMSVSYERQLPRNLYGFVEYEWTRGVHLLRSRNIAAPAPGTTAPADASLVLQFESTGRSSEHELTLGLTGSAGSTSAYAYCTWGKQNSDTDGAYSMPANSHDLSAEYGPSGGDVRHQFVAGATVRLPGGVYLNPYVLVLSGLPFNITTGRDNNGDTIFTDRPAFAEPDDPGAIATPYGLLNPNPQPGDRIIPRNLGRERMQITTNLSLSKSLPHGLTFSANIENPLNDDRGIGANGVVTSPVFGLPNQALDPRRVQLSIGYRF